MPKFWKNSIKYLIPFFAVVIFLPFSPTFDLAISHFFYTPDLLGKGHFIENALTDWMFEWGERIGFGVGAIATTLYLLAWKIPPLKKFRPACLLMMFTLVLGAGLCVNTLGKGCLARPRPKQVIEFGGTHAFRPVYQLGLQSKTDPQKSFPSGHASMGFYYLSVCLVAYRYRNKWLMAAGVALTLSLGMGLSLTRIAQGGHFFSDTLFAALIMWWITLFADWLVFKSKFSRNLFSHDQMHLS